METVYLLVTLAVTLVLIIVAVLLWAVRSDQFDDLEGPAHRILMDDDGLEEQTKQETNGEIVKRPH